MQESAPLAGNTHLYSFVKFFFFQMESGIRTFSVHQLIGSPWLEANVCCWCSPGRRSRDHRGRQGSKDPRLRDPAPVHRQTVRSDKTPHHGRNHRDIAHQSEIPSLLLMSDFLSARKKRKQGSVQSPDLASYCSVASIPWDTVVEQHRDSHHNETWSIHYCSIKAATLSRPEVMAPSVEQKLRRCSDPVC